MIVDVRAEQGAIERAEIAALPATDAEALQLLNASGETAGRPYLTNWSVADGEANVERIGASPTG